MRKIASSFRLGIIFGTRPEAIKVASIIRESRLRGLDVVTINSGQHREMLDPILDLFGISPCHDLEVMYDRQSLHGLTSRLASALGQVFATEQLDYIMVQGDTTTAFVGALAAFYEKIPVGHIEAGLRTNDRNAPFPEEANRRLISTLATHHFAPTVGAKLSLLREGHRESSIIVTGNTVIDAIRLVTEEHHDQLDQSLSKLSLYRDTPYILMTTHRRENHGAALREILGAVEDFTKKYSDISVVLPLHRNPEVRGLVVKELGQIKNVRLIESQGYVEFIALMKNALFILTDSGGIQEEAPYFNRRTLVMRDTTERPEAVDSGSAVLVGTSRRRIFSEMESALLEARSGDALSIVAKQPFGDGFAAGRILDFVLQGQQDSV